MAGRPMKKFPNRRTNRQYDPRNLEKAIEAVKSGSKNQKDAAAYFGIPKTTLNRALCQKDLKSVGSPESFVSGSRAHAG